LPGFNIGGDILTLIIAGSVLGLINIFIRPILRLISAPLIIISFGFFIIIINIILLWLLEYLISDLTIIGFWNYFWGVLIISVVNIVFGTGRKRKNKRLIMQDILTIFQIIIAIGLIVTILLQQKGAGGGMGILGGGGGGGGGGGSYYKKEGLKKFSLPLVLF